MPFQELTATAQRLRVTPQAVETHRPHEEGMVGDFGSGELGHHPLKICQGIRRPQVVAGQSPPV